MKSIYRRLTETSDLFEKIELTDENEIAITTGCAYDDQTELILYLAQRDDSLILTDNGRTRTFMDKIYELTSPDVIKNILSVTSYYGISTQNKQLSLKIEDVDENFCECYLKMMFCIGFLDSMNIFYI
ncbi:MAG: hypothetical protein LBH22_06710 [Bacteroidales bacterium]|jgi:hypothetical protein|nr:hypothetical protein [Bacteroidales bacterium]